MDTVTSSIPFDSVWTAIIITSLVVVSAFFQGMGGVGFTMILAPVAMILSPILVPGPLLALGCTVSIMATVREWEYIEWNNALHGLVGRTLGAAIALALLLNLTGQYLELFFSALIIIAVLLSFSGITFKTTSRNLTVAGTVSGVMSTLTSVGSPPLVIALQYGSPATIRATLSAILTGGTLASIVFLAIGGKFGQAEALATMWLIPFLFVGFWVSTVTRHHINRGRLRMSLLLFCLISAIALMLKTLL